MRSEIAVLRPIKGGKAVRRRGRAIVPYAMFLPAGVLLILLNFLTSGYGIYLSFLDFDYFNLERRFAFVGVQHYVEVLRDPVFFDALRNSAIWAIGVVPGSFLAGLYFALLLNEGVRWKALLRTVLLIPWVTPLVVVAILWSFMLSPGIGLLSDAFARLGRLDLKYENWLGDPNLALPVVMAVQVWRWTPFFAVALLAGLQAIPKDLYDAAEVDGAGMLRRFRHITLPLLAPVIFVLLLQALIWSAHNFSLIFVMTGGGPVHSSEVLTIYLWRTAFPHGQVSQAAAAGTIMIGILSLVGTLWVIKLLRRSLT